VVSTTTVVVAVVGRVVVAAVSDVVVEHAGRARQDDAPLLWSVS
jgi:hypothetical protein